MVGCIKTTTCILLVIIVLREINGALVDNSTNVGNETKEQVNSQLEARKKQQDQGMMNKILPFMVIPFMISTAIIPMMLVSLKVMLLKSAFIGKIAVILFIINMLRSRSSGQGGVFTHNVNTKEMSAAHYGYNGEDEYGAYINGRKLNLR